MLASGKPCGGFVPVHEGDVGAARDLLPFSIAVIFVVNGCNHAACALCPEHTFCTVVKGPYAALRGI